MRINKRDAASPGLAGQDDVRLPQPTTDSSLLNPCLLLLHDADPPQVAPYGLYTEQLSGTAFTVPRR